MTRRTATLSDLRCLLTFLCALCLLAPGASGQGTIYRLDDTGDWIEESVPEPGSDEAQMARARRMIAEGDPAEAVRLLSRWIERKRTSNSRWLPEAYLLRGDGKLAMREEYKALYDYETVINKYPGSEQFTTAVSRELQIALLYVGGLRLKVLGMRFEDSSEVAVELLIRVQERLPDSAAAEKAAITLGDFYYERRQMKLAQEAYDLYLENFPGGQHVMHAMSRQIFANVALFKGPEYDASTLINAREQILRFETLFPAEAERLSLESLEARIDESQGAQMLSTAEWYRKRKDPISERLTLRRLVAKHPRSVAAGKALQILNDRGWLVAEPIAVEEETVTIEETEIDEPMEEQSP